MTTAVPLYKAKSLEVREHHNSQKADHLMNNEQLYRCNLQCPIRKHCFIIKLKEPIPVPLIVLHKCEATKKDVEIIIGDRHPP